MAEGFRFMPLGLVRLRTFRLSTWVSWVQTWVQVLTRVRGGYVIDRCQNKNPIERLTSGCEWRHAPEARARKILEILKKSVAELSPASEENGWLSLARGGLGEVSHEIGGQMKKPELKECVSLSLCRRTFKLKGNKKFRTWTKKS